MQTTAEDTLVMLHRRLDALVGFHVGAFEADMKRIIDEARAKHTKTQAPPPENRNPNPQASDPAEKPDDFEEYLARFNRENPWFEAEQEATRQRMAEADSHQRFLKMVAAHVKWLEAKLTPTPKPKRPRKKRV